MDVSSVKNERGCMRLAYTPKPSCLMICNHFQEMVDLWSLSCRWGEGELELGRGAMRREMNNRGENDVMKKS